MSNFGNKKFWNLFCGWQVLEKQNCKASLQKAFIVLRLLKVSDDWLGESKLQIMNLF